MWGSPKPPQVNLPEQGGPKPRLPPEAYRTHDSTVRSKTQTSPPPSESDDIAIRINEMEEYKLHSSNITDLYMGISTYYSTTLDIVTIYLKGQKLLYVESKTYCEMCLYFLMLPAIFISASCTVLSVALKNVNYGSVIVSGLTAINSFILGIVTYLKLDAKSEAHKTASYQFDKLQTRSEFFSGKIYMVPNNEIVKNVTAFFDDLEKKVTEIKDVNQFPIPEHIRRKYAKIYGQNVFSDMKLHKTIRNKNVQRLIIIDDLIKNYDPTKERKGKPQSIKVETKSTKLFNWFDDPPLIEKEEEEFNLYEYKLEELQLEKQKMINQIIEYRNVSIKMNEIFNEQIKRHLKRSHRRCKCTWFCPYFCLKT